MLRIALFGAGRIGAVHAESIAAHPRAELAWVCDPAEPAAEALAARCGGRASTDPGTVLADPAIDGVVIGSPTPTHVDLLTAAARAGRAVLCEKPIDLDLGRVDACWAEIGPRSPAVMVGFNRRFDPSFREIHDRVRAGDIGPVEQLAITSRDPAPPPAGYVASSGGLFRDMTIHDFDLARFLLGEITEVQAAGANLIEPYIETAGDVDSAIVVLRAASGALAQITNSRRCRFGYDQRVEVFGADGMLSAANQLPTSVRYAGAERSEAAAPYLNFFRDRYEPAYRAELDQFVVSMETGAPMSPSFADGRAALVLANAAVESLETGRVVRVAS
ncbi:MAG: inositol 2-dehydrogenase [Actinobacteria bacterium]|nr:inositol 2-dehydrogenase [Actinomycetota bacterium]